MRINRLEFFVVALSLLAAFGLVRDARAGELYSSRSFLQDFNFADYDLRDRGLPSISRRRYALRSTAVDRSSFNMFRPLPGTGVNIFEERRFAYARWRYNYERRAYDWYVRELQKSERDRQRSQYRQQMDEQRRSRAQSAQVHRASIEARDTRARSKSSDNFFSRWTSSESTEKSTTKTKNTKDQKPSFWGKLKYSLFGDK